MLQLYPPAYPGIRLWEGRFTLFQLWAFVSRAGEFVVENESLLCLAVEVEWNLNDTRLVLIYFRMIYFLPIKS